MRWEMAIVCALAVATHAGIAGAQDEVDAAGAVGDGESTAADEAATDEVGEPTAADEAGEHYDAGVELFKAGDFEGALEEFRAAYEIAPHYQVRYNIGVTLFNLERFVEAQEELQAFLDEGGDGIPEEKLTETQAILYEVEAGIGTIVVSGAPKGAVLWIDGEATIQLPKTTTFAIDAGTYDLEIKAKGYRSYVQEVTVTGKKQVDIEVHMKLDKASKVPMVPMELAACSGDSDCIDGWVCMKEQCVPKRLDLGRKLVMAGAITCGSGLLLGITGIVVSLAAGSPAGPALMGVGFLVLLGGIGMLIPGIIFVKRARRRLLVPADQGDAALLAPFAAPVPGGGMMGVQVVF